MRSVLRVIVGVALSLIATLATGQPLDMGRMAGDVWGAGNRNVVVILHGDGGPGRYDGYAQQLAAAAKGTTVVTMVRPGFRGRAGGSAGGNRGKDHYTKRNNKLLAEGLLALKKSVGTQNMIVVGHSGGSGQLGTIVATHPGIVDVAILAACPCDVPNWRRQRRGQNNWTQSQSPHRFADRIPANTKVIAITNTRDANTSVRFAQTYVDIAKSAGTNVEFITPKGGSHGWRDYMPHVHRTIVQNLR